MPSGLAWLIVRRNDDTIYRSQLKSRADAPAARLLAGLPLLTRHPDGASDGRAASGPPARLSVEEALAELERAGVSGAPVIDEARRFEGTVARAGLISGAGHNRSLDELADPGAQTVPVSSHLDLALEALTEAPLSWVPVLDGDRRVVGTLSLSDLMRAYRRELLASVARLSDLAPRSAGLEVQITADSPVAGKTLRAAGLPKGVIVTSITRGGEVVLPSGDTVILLGDRLALLGDRRGVEVIGKVARWRCGVISRRPRVDERCRGGCMSLFDRDQSALDAL